MDDFDKMILDVQELAKASTNDLMNLRENIVNEINGLMDYIAEDTINLQLKLQELQKKHEKYGE